MEKAADELKPISDVATPDCGIGASTPQRGDLAQQGIHGVNPELAARLVRFGFGRAA